MHTFTRRIFPNVDRNIWGASPNTEDEEPDVPSSTTIMRLANEICRLSTAIESQSSQLGEVAANVQKLMSSLEGENLVRR